MRNCKSARMWRGFTSIMALLMAALIPATYIVNENLEFLNARLGTTSTQMVDTGDGSTDSIYYDSEFSSLAELVAEKDALAEEISEEGSVLLKKREQRPAHRQGYGDCYPLGHELPYPHPGRHDRLLHNGGI